mgnify:CR=1 FL=1
MNFKVVIPARFASTRLPGKPLLDIGGRPMVLHVVERALESGADEVWVATDHQGIADAVRAGGYRVCMTSPDHPSGTDRIAEVASQRGWGDDEVVVNVQGDEPLIEPSLIREVAQHLHDHPEAAISTSKLTVLARASIKAAIIRLLWFFEPVARFFQRLV